MDDRSIDYKNNVDVHLECSICQHPLKREANGEPCPHCGNKSKDILLKPKERINIE